MPEQQLTFLKPDDAAMLHLLRRFLAEASRLYETRTGQSLAEATLIRHPLDAYNFLRLEMEDLPHEQLYAISLNTRGRVLSTAMIYQGSLNTITLRMAEVFRPAIMDNAASLIVAHNHPSGDPNPSPEDVHMTEQLIAAGKLLDIDVLDHLVIGKGQFVSLKERRLGFNLA